MPSGGKYKHAFSCWNCGDDTHSVPKCPKAKDRARIDKARKEFMEKKKRGGGAPTTNTNKNDYSCSRFGHPGQSDNGVKKINGVSHCFCRKCDKWNQLHTTKFHGEWVKDPKGFKLGPNHPFTLAVKAEKAGTKIGVSSEGDAESKKDSTPSSTNTLFAKLSSKCGEVEANAKDPNMSQMAGLMKTLFASLNK